jgi:hypothetical protein
VKRFLLLLLIAAAARAGTFTTVDAFEYARPDGKALLMDLRGGPAIRQASRGYAVASIDYQLDGPRRRATAR